jgi:2-alkenal reductase
MRGRFVTVLLAGVLGGLAVLGIGRAAGWIGNSGTKTVVFREVNPAPAAATATVPAVKPLIGNSFDPARIYALRSPGVVTIYAFFGGSTTQASQGSGFVVSREGYVLTNSHVITDVGERGTGSAARPATDLYVEFSDRDRVKARIVGWDVFDDVGLIKVDSSDHTLTPLPLGDARLIRVGEPVAAIGSPFGNENSLAVGVVSAVHRSIESLTSDYDLVDAIQTDAAINHGNSGGPLFNAAGRVIGINAQIRSESGNAEGVGFAVSIDSVRRSMEQLIAHGKVSYAYVGVTTEDLTPALARHLHLPISHGAIVDSVLAGSPGDKAGLHGATRREEFNGTVFGRGGDVIVAIDGRPVASAEDVIRLVSGRLRPDQTTTFTIVRGGHRREVPVVLAARPQNPHSGG